MAKEISRAAIGVARCRSRPRRRAVDRAAMRPDRDYVWQLALRRKVAGDVPAICGVEPEVCRTLARIEHDGLPLEFVPYKVERRNKVGISGDDDKRIGYVCVGVAEKRGREIDIRSLFFNLYHVNKSIWGCRAFLASGIYGRNPCFVLVVVAFNNIYSAMRVDGLKVDVLPFNRCWIVGICLGSGGEVLDSYKFMVRVELGVDKHCVDKPCEIEPLASRESAQQPMVEVATVDVCYCLHLHSIKKRGPQTLRSKTLFRVGRALRLDVNLLTGSVGIVPNLSAVRKGADFVTIDFENENGRSAA